MLLRKEKKSFFFLSLISVVMRFKYKLGGSVAQGFEPVKIAFESSFASGRERDAQCCAIVDGQTVVDLWGSAADSPNAGRYDGDSLQAGENKVSGKLFAVYVMKKCGKICVVKFLLVVFIALFIYFFSLKSSV